MNVFEELDHRLQDIIYHDLGWYELRPMQNFVIKALLQHVGDLLVTAPTASGKTEAVFFPLISRCLKEESPGIKILYISPLKALLNNQEARIKRLCPQDTIPVTVWHGDTKANDKRKLRKNPDGIVLITPESLEAIMNAAASHPEDMFKGTRYVIIDEIHALAGSTRGTHVLSLLRRLEAKVGHQFSVVGLSATMSNPLDCARWLRPQNPDRVLVISDDGAGTIVAARGYKVKLLSSKLEKHIPKLRGYIYAWDFSDCHNNEEDDIGTHYLKTISDVFQSNNSSLPRKVVIESLSEDNPSKPNTQHVDSQFLKSIENKHQSDLEKFKLESDVLVVAGENLSDKELISKRIISSQTEIDYGSAILKHAGNKKILAFVNSRSMLIDAYSLLKNLVKYKKEFRTRHVIVHHGMMNGEDRKMVEDRILHATNGVLVLCTSTLELGIDIGDVDEVFFLNAPYSVNSFMQRIGRSGRRAGQIPTFRFFIAARNFSFGRKPYSDNDIFHLLYPEVVRAVALVRLALKNKIEPLTDLFPDASTFVFQILSYIAAERVTTLPKIYNAIGREAFLSYFSKSDFVSIMKKLCNENNPLIAQDQNGTIHLTKRGEYFCQDKDFFSSFVGEKFIELRTLDMVVGQIPHTYGFLLQPDIVIKLGDNLWKVEQFNGVSSAIVSFCKEANNYLDPKLSTNGRVCISNDLAFEEYQVLFSESSESYLSPLANKFLKKGSQIAQQLRYGGHVLFVWAGSKVLQTLCLLLRYALPDESFIYKEYYIISESLQAKLMMIHEDRTIEYIDTPCQVMTEALVSLDITEDLLEDVLAEYAVELRCILKYDDKVPQQIIDREYIKRYLDLEGAKNFVAQLKNGYNLGVN